MVVETAGLRNFIEVIYTGAFVSGATKAMQRILSLRQGLEAANSSGDGRPANVGCASSPGDSR